MGKLIKWALIGGIVWYAYKNKEELRRRLQSINAR